MEQAFSSISYDEWTVQFQDQADFAKVEARTAQDCFLAYQIRGVPTILVFNPKGEIVHQASGFEEISKVHLHTFKEL